eukprot:CAMPEP_0198571284 /NCGR_PEP_ID=MMETSP1462-20131121/110266_1 /TAXON_ID=1333877 /ORGANISM="Brandtodinium nutriculum, Strain RCC3387" /LENGTH=35 /DNA_ID= /DNA_START= /DNA_END= /DNA_ORIENTATION=
MPRPQKGSGLQVPILAGVVDMQQAVRRRAKDTQAG